MKFSYISRYTQFISIYTIMGYLSRGSGFKMMYVKVCTADVPCTDGYIHFKKCTDILELCTYIDVSF